MNKKLLNRCRACAGSQASLATMVSLFEKDLSEMFKNCTSLEIALHDRLPSHICFECFGNLSNFNKFRQNCANSDTFLREQLDLCPPSKSRSHTNVESIKAEPLDEIVMKYEVNEGNQDDRDFESDFDKNEIYFAQHDPQSLVRNGTAFAEHISSDTFNKTKFICDYCGRQFGYKSHLASHMNKHKYKIPATIRPKNFLCDVNGCMRVFERKKLLNDHRLKVHKLKPETGPRFCCQQCPETFKIQYKFDAHIREEHEGLKPFKCPYCEKEFIKARGYRHHVQFRHSDGEIKKFKCTYDGCNKEYPVRESLRIHILRFHEKQIPELKNRSAICDQCGRTFTNSATLKNHLYLHSGKQPFACGTCPKKFTTKHRLKIHTMRHLNIRPFECTTCGARKTTNKELQAHLNFHSKSITFPCKECDRVFTSYAARDRHVRIHHRNHKPYICPHCNRAFAKAETMKNHVMTHTGEKPFSCSICGHRFIQNVALKKHMNVHAKK